MIRVAGTVWRRMSSWLPIVSRMTKNCSRWIRPQRPLSFDRPFRWSRSGLANGVINNEHDKRLLILFTESLDIGLAVRIEKFLPALLPRRFEFGRCDVPVGPAFL